MAAQELQAYALMLALVGLPMLGCAADAKDSTDSAPAEPESASQWTIPFESSEGGCSGSVTLSGSADWAAVGGTLGRSNATISAFCDHADRYEPYIDSWDLSTVLRSVWPDGFCDEAPSFELSGQEGVLCQYDFNGNHFIQAVALVGPYYVQVQGQLAESTDVVLEEVDGMIRSATISID